MSESSAELLRLIVELVGHLAWPVTLLTLALLFAPTLRRLAERVSHLEVAGAKLSLNERVQAAVAGALSSDLTVVAPSSGLRLPRTTQGTPPVLPAPPSEAAPFPSPPPSPRDIAREGDLTTWIWSPEQARGGSVRSALERSLDYIVDTLDKVERQMIAIASRDLGRTADLAAAIDHLRRRDVLDSRSFPLYESLRLIRNEALEAGSARFDATEAANWASLCLTLTQRVDQRARMLGLLAD